MAARATGRRAPAAALPALAALALVTLGAPLPLAAQPPPPAEPPDFARPGPAEDARDVPVVAAVEIRSDAPLRDPAEARSLIAFAPGEPLTEAAVERTLRNLRASGLAETAAVYRRPAEGAAAAGAVVAIVVIEASILVDAVRVEGDTGALKAAELGRLIPQRPGTPLVSDRVVRGVFRLQDELREAGYFERSVRVVPQIDPERKRAVVVYRVQAGPRATVGTVEFEGDLGPFGREELLAPLRLKPGQPYRRAAAEEDAERLQDWLVTEARHRKARVDPPDVEYHAVTAGVNLTFPVEAGPRVEVVVEGAEIEKLRKEGLLPFLGDEGYDEALLLQAAGAIESWYQRRGHYDVEVATAEETAGGTLNVSLAVEPGPVYTLRGVLFQGNEEVGDATLRELMVTGERTLLAVGSGRLVDSVLEDDLDNIRAYYALQGYARAQIGPPIVERTTERDLVLAIPIVEGPRVLVGSLEFEGVHAFEPGELAKRIPLAEGGPFHPLLLEQSLESVRVAYAREGYDSAQVSGRRVEQAADAEAGEDGGEPEDGAGRVDLTIEVLEGPQTVLDRVIVRGNQRTDEAVIRRAVGVRRGDPVSGSLLLEIERRLYGLGIFTRAEAELTPAPLGATTRDLLIRVEEGQTRRLTYGAGYDTEDGFGGILGYSHGNLFGKGMRLTGDAQVRQENQQFRLFVDHPYFPGLGLPVTYALFRTQQRRETIEVEKVGTRVETVRGFDRVRLALAYQYQNVNNRVIGEGTSRTPAAREDQTQRVSSLAPSILIDHRDDPIDPHRGWSAGAELEWAFPFPFAAEADFLKLQVQHTYLLDTGIDLGTGRWILAASVRAGGIEPLSGLDLDDPFIPPGLDLPSEEIFVAERFFGGGRNSHRAFERDRLGIPGETLFPDEDGDLVPSGGNGLLLINVDLRFPLFGALGGTIFYDTGNVWADWRDLDASDLRDGVGLGLRYLSPLGPLRFEVGWPLDRLPGDDTLVFHFSLGYPF
jgi:outer membrane protein insertion porin family